MESKSNASDEEASELGDEAAVLVMEAVPAVMRAMVAGAW